MEKCEDCQKVKPDVRVRECPFAADVYNETILVTICDECEYERAMDI